MGAALIFIVPPHKIKKQAANKTSNAMPKYVDHQQRRQELIEQAALVIAKQGLEHATMKSISLAAGFSANLAAHYFANKDELLWHVQRFVGQRAARRFLQSADQSLPALIESVLPFCKETIVEWKVRSCFWSRAINDRQLAKAQDSIMRQVRADMTEVIESQQQAGAVKQNIDIALAVERLLNLANALGIQVLLEPKHYNQALCQRLIQAALADLMA